MLTAVARADRMNCTMCCSAAVAQVFEKVSIDSPEALVLDWHLKAAGHPGIIPTRAVCMDAEPCETATDSELVEARAMDIVGVEGWTKRQRSSKDNLNGLQVRLDGQPMELGSSASHALLSPGSATARVTWATVAAYAPCEVLSVMPTVSGTIAELLLGAPDDGAWRYATQLVTPEVVEKDCRRRGHDGNQLSCRETFQEIATQRLFSWGVDGTVTGHEPGQHKSFTTNREFCSCCPTVGGAPTISSSSRPCGPLLADGAILQSRR